MKNSSEKEKTDLNKSKEDSQGEALTNLDKVSSASTQDVSLNLEQEASQNAKQVSSDSAQNVPLNILSASSLSAIAGLLTGPVQSSVSLDDENVNITLSFPKSYFEKIYLHALEGKLAISKPGLEEMRSIASSTGQCASGMDRVVDTSYISAGFTEDEGACEENAANDSKTSEADVCNKGNVTEIDESTTMTESGISSEQSIITGETGSCLMGNASNIDSDKSHSITTVDETQCSDKDTGNGKEVKNYENLPSNSGCQTASVQSDNIVVPSGPTSTERASPFSTAAIKNNENESTVSKIDKTKQDSDESVCSIPSEVDQNESANFASTEVEMGTSVLEVDSKAGESCEETFSETLRKPNSASDVIGGFQIAEQASAAKASKEHEFLNTSKAGEKKNLEVGNLDEEQTCTEFPNFSFSSLNVPDNQCKDINKTSILKSNLIDTSNLSREFQSVLMASHSNYEVSDAASPSLQSTNEITVVPTKEINTASPSSVKYFELDLPEYFVFVKITSREGDISVDAAKYKKDNTSGSNSESQQNECSMNLSVENRGNESAGRNEHKEAENARSEVTETKPQISKEVRAKNLEMANNLRAEFSQELVNLHKSRTNLNQGPLIVFGRKMLSEMGIELDCDPPGFLPCVPSSEKDSSIEMYSSDKNISLEMESSDSTSDVVIIEPGSVEQVSAITIDNDSSTEVNSEDCVADSNTSNSESTGSETVEEMSVDDIDPKELTDCEESITDSKKASRVEEVATVASTQSFEVNLEDYVADSNTSNSEFTGSETVEEMSVDDIDPKELADCEESITDSKKASTVEEVVTVAEDSILVENVKTGSKPVIYDETLDRSEQVTEGVFSSGDSEQVTEGVFSPGDSEQVAEGAFSPGDSEQVTEGETASEDSEQVTEGATLLDDSEQVMEGETASKNCEKIKSTIDVEDSVVTEDISLVEDTGRVRRVTIDLEKADVTVIEYCKEAEEDNADKNIAKEYIKVTSYVDVNEYTENLQESEATGRKFVGIATEDSKVLKDNKTKVCKKENQVTAEDNSEREDANDSKHVRKDSVNSERDVTEISNAENLDSDTKSQDSEQVDTNTSTAVEKMEDIESCQNIVKESSDAENSEATSECLANVADDPSEELSHIESETDNLEWVLQVSQTEDNERLELTTDEEDKLLELSAGCLNVVGTDPSEAVGDGTPAKHSAGVTKETSKNTSEAFDNSSTIIGGEKESDTISIKDKYISKDRQKRPTTIEHIRNASGTLEKEIETISSEIISNDERCISYCSETKISEEIESKKSSRRSSAASSDSDKANEESEEEVYELYKVNKSQNEEPVKKEFFESDQNVIEGKTELPEGMNVSSNVAEKSSTDLSENVSEPVAALSDTNISEQKEETCDEETGEVSADESLKDGTEIPVYDENGNLRQSTSTERKRLYSEDLTANSKIEDIDSSLSSLQIGESALESDSNNSNASIDQSFDVVDAAPTRVRDKKFPAPPLSQEVIPEDNDGKEKNKSSKGDSQNKDASLRSKSPVKRSLRSRNQESTVNVSLGANKMTSKIKPNESLETSRESSVEKERIATRKKRESTPDIKIKERVAVAVRSSPRKASLKVAADSSSTASKIELSTPQNTRISSQMSLEKRSSKLRPALNTVAAASSIKKSKRGSKEK